MGEDITKSGNIVQKWLYFTRADAEKYKDNWKLSLRRPAKAPVRAGT
jgi:hypothetical protein